MEETKRRLEINLLNEQIRKPLLTREQIEFGIIKFRRLDLSSKEGRQRLIDGFVNVIYLFDDYVKIIYNYRDGTQTVVLDDLLSSDNNSAGAPQKALFLKENGAFLYRFSNPEKKSHPASHPNPFFCVKNHSQRTKKQPSTVRSKAVFRGAGIVSAF